MSELTLQPPKKSQAQRILELLKAKGSATNRELNRVAFRYSARVKNLRDEGYQIVTVREKDGLYRFVYKGLRGDV